MTDKSQLHTAHALVATVLFLVGMYLFYERDLNGPKLTPPFAAATIGACTFIILALYAVHLRLQL